MSNPPAIDADRPRFFVYYLNDADGNTLYVGRSSDVARRLKAHHYHAQGGGPVHWRKADWFFDVRDVSMVGPFGWQLACATERSEIRRLQPRGNVKHTRRDPQLRINREDGAA